MTDVPLSKVTDASASMPPKAHCHSLRRLRYHPLTMLSRLISRMPGRRIEELPRNAGVASAVAGSIAKVDEKVEETTLLRTIGWLTAGLGAVAIGLFVGRELRQRYKFNRRTPYDFYSHSGDEVQDMEFGVGI